MVLTQCQAPYLLIKRYRLDSLFNIYILIGEEALYTVQFIEEGGRRKEIQNTMST